MSLLEKKNNFKKILQKIITQIYTKKNFFRYFKYSCTSKNQNKKNVKIKYLIIHLHRSSNYNIPDYFY